MKSKRRKWTKILVISSDQVCMWWRSVWVYVEKTAIAICFGVNFPSPSPETIKDENFWYTLHPWHILQCINSYMYIYVKLYRTICCVKKPLHHSGRFTKLQGSRDHNVDTPSQHQAWQENEDICMSVCLYVYIYSVIIHNLYYIYLHILFVYTCYIFICISNTPHWTE